MSDDRPAIVATFATMEERFARERDAWQFRTDALYGLNDVRIILARLWGTVRGATDRIPVREVR